MMGSTFQIGRNENAAGIQARLLPGIILVDEPIPIDYMVWLSEVLGEGGVVDSSLARWTGARLAFRQKGPVANAARERSRLNYREQIATSVRAAGLSEGVADWLASDDVGASSMTILSRLSDFRDPVSPGDGPTSSLPSDASELRRCRLLVEHDDGALWGRFSDMSDVSDGWARLVKGWDDVCEVMDLECRTWREGVGACPETNHFLKVLLAPAST